MTRTILTGDQRTPEWFAMRLGCATGSVFSDVLAKGSGGKEATTRETLRVKLALEIITGRPSEQGFSNRHTKLGTEREPLGLQAFENATGNLLEQVAFIKLDGRRVGVSPDSLIEDNAGVELKCPTPHVHFSYLSLTTKPPAEYVAQVQGNLLVSGRDHWYFASFNPEFPKELQLHWFRVERDEPYINAMDDALWRFSYDVDQTVKSMRDMVLTRQSQNKSADSPELMAKAA